jgi:hypothetical protein
MAKLLFSKGQPIDSTTFQRAIKVDGDAAGHAQLDKCEIVDISDEDYEAFFNGTKNLVIENNTPTFVARIEDETQVDKEVFTQSYNNFKQNLEFSISMKPSHSKITEAQACLSFINTIDVDSISYPTDHLDKQMKDNGTFVALSAF